MFSVLYVDDEQALLELGKLFLERAMEFRVETAVCARDALAMLATRPFDAVISDYQMPEMDGIALLKAVREGYGDLPFILFTGRGREDVVIEAINNGADFYLQKGGDVKSQFAELSHKIRQSVARRQAEHSLRESEKRLSDIIEFLPDATLAINRDGVIIAWNRAIEEMTGIPANSMLGKGDHEYALPFYGERRPILIDLIFEPSEVIEQKYTHIVRKKDVLIADTTLPRLQGREATLVGKASPLYNSLGEIVGAIEAIRDITDQKRAEDELRAAYEQITASEGELREQLVLQEESEIRAKESEEKYRDLFENSVVGIFRTTTDGTFSAINGTFARIAGYDSPQQMMETIKDVRTQLYVNPEDRDRFLNGLKTDGVVKDFEAQYYHRDGHAVWILINAKAVRDVQGEVRYFEGTIEDITEQKKATEALIQEKIFSAAVLESIPGLLYLYDSEGRLVRWNESHKTVTGYTAEELAGMHLLDWFKGDDEAIRVISEGVGRALKEGQATAEANLLTKSGKKIPFFFTAKRLEIDKKTYFTGVGIDITDRQRAQDEIRAANEQLSASQEELQGQLDELIATEQRIKESEEKFRALADAALEGIMIHERGVITDCNPQFARMFGYQLEEIIGRNGFEFMLTAESRDAIAQWRQKGAKGTIDIIGIKKDGSMFSGETATTTILWQGKQHSIVQIHDITDRKNAEGALCEREATLASIFRAAPVGIGLVSKRVLIRANDRLCEMTGYSAGELIGKSARILYPDDEEFERVGREKYERIRKSGTGTVETRWQRKDGDIRDILLSSTPLDPENLATGVTFTALDITESKRAEDALRIKDTVFESSIAANSIGNNQGIITSVNTAFLHIWGYRTKEDAIGKSIARFFAHEKDAVPVLETLDTFGRWEGEFTALRVDGSIFIAFGIATVIRDEAGKQIGYQSTLLDITERKRAEEELWSAHERLTASEEELRGQYEELAAAQEKLLMSEQQLGEIAGTVPGVVYQFYARPDGNMGVYYVSSQAEEIFGFNDRTQDFFSWFTGRVDPRDREALLQSIHAVVKAGQPWNFEGRFIKPSGEKIWFQGISRPIARQGELVYSGVLLDITQRKIAEVALGESEWRYRTLYDNLRDGSAVVDLEGKIIQCNAAFTGITGYSGEELKDLTYEDLTPEKWQESENKILKEQVDTRGYSDLYEKEYRQKDGNVIPIEIQTYVRRNLDNQRTGYWAIIRDITDRKRADKTLNESKDRFRRLLSSSFDAVVVHQEGRIVLANDAAARIIGAASTADLVGRPVVDLVHPEFRTQVAERVRQILQSTDGIAPLIEEKFVRCDGTSIDVEVMAATTHHEGHPAVMVVFRDIMDRKAAEKELREAEKNYRTLVENSQSIIYTIRPDGIMTFVSPSWTKLLGHEPSEVVDHDFRSFVHSSDIPACDEFLKKTVEMRTTQPGVEYRVFHKDGSIRWHQSNITPVFDEQNTLISFVGNAIDFTDRKLAEEALSESEALLGSILHGTPVLQFVIDRNHKVISWNKAIEVFSGIMHEEIIGTDQQWRAFYPEKRPVLADLLVDEKTGDIPIFYGGKFSRSQLAEGAYEATDFFPIRGASGKWLFFTAAPIRDSQGTIIGAVETLEDITERRIAEQAVREANHKLNLLNSITRHDVANQLTVLQGYAQIAAMKKGDPVMADYLAKILSAADTIARQIEFTRTYQELGVKAPAWIPLEGVIPHMQSRVPVTFSGTCKGVEIFADPMLGQVFFNLVDNVARHGGRVTEITVRCEREPDGILVIVEDNGTGVPPGHKERIFERGVGKNTGLGLFLVREILSITAITIKETGIYGKGARFEIAVPERMYRFVTTQ